MEDRMINTKNSTNESPEKLTQRHNQYVKDTEPVIE